MKAVSSGAIVSRNGAAPRALASTARRRSDAERGRKLHGVVHQEQLGPGVGRDVLELALAVAGVQRHDRAAGGQGADRADAGLDARLSPDRHTPGPGDPLGHRRGGGAQLRVAQLCLAHPERGRILRIGEARQEHQISENPPSITNSSPVW